MLIKKSAKFFLASMMILPSLSFAHSYDTIFSCFMKNGKHLLVLEVGDIVRYSYGKPGHDEMVFTNRKSDVSGFCGSEACNISMYNKGTEYFIWASYKGSDGGVVVSKNGKQLADTRCSVERVGESIVNFDRLY